MVDEAKLLMRLKQKQENSINQAIEIYTPYLSTVLYNTSTSLSKEDAEEIISDVFVALWKNAEYIDLEKGSVRTYIATIARNLAYKRLRKNIAIASLDEIEVACDKDMEKDCVVHDAVWQAVMSLGEPDSEIFVRCYKYGERIRDIAKATGINVSTIKSKLSRGKKKLKIILENAEETL
jgi:RNA polymerase sigma-70 factor (ECF subfamily)